MTLQSALTQALKSMKMDPESVNSGRCHIFAERVKGLFPRAQIQRDDNCDHFWIFYGGKCYDAECFRGVKRPEKLPIFKYEIVLE